MKPEQVGYTTELDLEYSKALGDIDNFNDQEACDAFQAFLDKYRYWLDEESKELHGNDWAWLWERISDCRSDKTMSEFKGDEYEFNEHYGIAMELMMPAKLMKVSEVKCHAKVPWGCVYIRMKEEGVIDY